MLIRLTKKQVRLIKSIILLFSIYLYCFYELLTQLNASEIKFSLYNERILKMALQSSFVGTILLIIVYHLLLKSIFQKSSEKLIKAFLLIFANLFIVMYLSPVLFFMESTKVNVIFTIFAVGLFIPEINNAIKFVKSSLRQH